LCACLALAGAGSPAAEVDTYKLRAGTAYPEEARLALAASGKPSWRTVPAGGATLRKMLRAECGSQGPQVDQALEALTLKLNGGDSIDRAVSGGGGVALPFCLKVERNVKVQVQDGDTLEGLLRTHHGVAGPVTLDQAFQLNNRDHRWSSVQEFSRSLRPGQWIVLPSAAGEATFRRAESPRDLGFTSSNELQSAARIPHRRTEEGQEALNEILASTLPARTAPDDRDFERELAPAARGPQDYEYVRFVSNEPGGRQWCTEAAADPPPFDVALLKKRYAIEAEAASRYDPYLVPPVIGVIDTGIAVDTGVFASRFMRVNPREQRGTEAEDDDQPRNGFIDDIYGVNLNEGSESGSILYYEGVDPNFEHGTKIATLILGGKDWVDGWDSERPWARLKVVNFSSASAPHPVDAIKLSQAIDYLVQDDARVVNLSLQNQQSLVPVHRAMEDARRTLFVAAAGNTPSGGEDLATDKVYPAAEGGAEGALSRVVLTVGAHARDGSWAGFSNYSDRFVDLLAPGCAVPTLNKDAVAVNESGTSVATAITSFAAGLIASLGETDGRNIKTRLMVGVDVDPALKERARTSGRLNIVKGVSLSTDVIELMDRSAPYAFGRIGDRDQLRTFCDDEAKRKKLGPMRKVRPNVAGAPGATRIEYWIQSDDSLAVIDCPQIDGNPSIVLDGREGAGPALKDVRDIVLSDRRP
jgi:hypothetical protein